MSKIAKNPVPLPAGVNFTQDEQNVSVKGAKGTLAFLVPKDVAITVEEEGALKVSVLNPSRQAAALAGTTRSLLNNMLIGVTTGFERKLELVGVGYRAQVKGSTLSLILGFSHPVEFPIPEEISIETPSPTEIVIKGIDKQRVGQIAANIRRFRPPEPYKGKGVRYSGETLKLKEAKKK